MDGPQIAMTAVQELLANLQGSVSESLLSAFRTTVNHVSGCLGVSTERLAISDLIDAVPPLRSYLEQRRYKRTSVSSYCKFVQMMLSRAKQLGWTPAEPEVPEPWKEIFEAARKAGVKNIVRYAIRHKISTSNFGDVDLDAWGAEMLARRRKLTTICDTKIAFKRMVRNCGFQAKLPSLSRLNIKEKYCVRLTSFPPRLRSQVEDLLAFKQAKFAQGRPHKSRIRAVTAEGLKTCIQELFGFATKIEPTLSDQGAGQTAGEPEISDLIDLITSKRVAAWVRWRLETRGILNKTAAGDVAMLRNAIRYFPPFKELFNSHKFDWLSELMKEIPPDPKTGVDDRKRPKLLAYGDVADIPRKILETREKVPEGEYRRRAILTRDALLISWLVTLPWRQRNIRECLLGHNLFKRGLGPMSGIAIPKRVKERLVAGSSETYWQFDFREDETKNGERARGIVPCQLISLLEEYLEHYRPRLLNGSDPSTLFVSAQGKRLDSAAVQILVGDLTYRYGGKRVTPHLFRDIFAYQWLSERPTDYLTLSKHLWHRDVSTTLNRYGSQFDMSQAACEVEAWLETRRAGL